jgi:hypothetical protein
MRSATACGAATTSARGQNVATDNGMTEIPRPAASVPASPRRCGSPGSAAVQQRAAINSLAPYLLIALIDRPDRLIYLGSDMHEHRVIATR